ncbi:MAG: hypothetical protein JRH17_17935 [Deltaproteobacteria bacterium]|jgi:hypothetical protein|nr:hypothetical protein [Deltaproteobacteria bacterium]MBW2232269.1 hypothetical protein [Deltaproteobacteria bacterium]
MQDEWIGLDPTSGPLERKDDRIFRPRPDSLDGHVIGLVANGLGRGELLLDGLYERLSADTELAGAVRVLKSSVSVAPEPADWARLTSEATVAITGFGG